MNEISIKANSLKSLVKTYLKTAKIRKFVDMGWEKSDKLTRIIKKDLPLGVNANMLPYELEKLGYYQAKKYLYKTLPELTIGNKFDAPECKFLDLLDGKESISLFASYNKNANRTMNMWHAFYKFNPVESVNLLDSLADTNIDLLKKALMGNKRLEEEQLPLVSDILKISAKNEVTLPVSLVKLGDPMIMKAVQDLGRKKLSYFFFANREDGDLDVARSVLSELSVEKAFGVYRFLVKKEIIEASEALDEICPDKEALKKAIDGTSASKIEKHIQEALLGTVSDTESEDNVSSD